jgi:hypothetical protein
MLRAVSAERSRLELSTSQDETAYSSRCLMSSQRSLWLTNSVRSEAATKLRSVKHHVDFAPGQLLVRRHAVERLVLAGVPDHHCSGTILALGNHALELCVFERMIFDPYRQTFVMEGPLGTAQDTKAPLIARRKS